MPKQRRSSKKSRSSKKRQSPSLWQKMPWRLLGKIALVMAVPALIGVAYLDYVVRAKFEGKKWSLPARVYARPLELYAGLNIKPEHIRYELQALGYQSSSNPQQAGQYRSNYSTIDVYSRGFQFWDKAEDSKLTRIHYQGETITALTNILGQQLDILRLEPQEIGGIYPTQAEDRLLVRLQDIPPLLGEALIAVEDKNFRQHHGISLRGIARAMWVNFRSGQLVQGGSTLTQQLVKNFYLDQSRSLTRKGLEAIMALSLDARYSKAEILETYINEVYLGQSGAIGIHGFALGSQHYFRQPLNELKLNQLALLVGIVKGASYYNPWRNPERAIERRNIVLDVLLDNKLISEDEYALAFNSSLDVVKNPNVCIHSYPDFMALVKQQVRADYAEEDLQTEGLRIFTTLSPWIQKQSENAVNARLNQLENNYALPEGELQSAVVVSAVGSGEVLAVVGDRFQQVGFNRALDARRPIGSLVKPAVYLAALEKPETYTLTTPVDDSEFSLMGDTGQLWEPKNFSLESHGKVPLLFALAESYNQATARLGVDVGVEKVIEKLKELGLDREVSPLPSVLLGAVDLSPWQVSQLYQTLASEGVYTPQRAILSVMDAQGSPLKRYPLRPEVRIDPETAHLLQFALQTTMRQGTGKTLYSEWEPDWLVAGKTGTTNDQRDSWFAGYSGDHLAVVWVGRDDNGPTPLTGATGAMRIWSHLFQHVSSRPLQPVKPRSINYLWVDPSTEMLLGENCRGAVLIPYVRNSEPKVPGQCDRINHPAVHWLRNLIDADEG